MRNLYCARPNWIVGSPKTVAEKLEQIRHEAGGFDVRLVFGFDYRQKSEAFAVALEERDAAAPEASRRRDWQVGVTAFLP